MHPDLNDADDMTDLAELVEDTDDAAPEISPDGVEVSGELRVG